MLDRRFFENQEREIARALRRAQLASSRGRRHPEPEHALPHGVPARSRSRRPLHRVSAPRVQDAGLRQPRGRSLPHSPHPLPRGRADRADGWRGYLQLNEDLTEAVTLAHDLGHTPFGHAGEDAMNELMADHGGFEHNLQALRIVDHLEKRYPGLPRAQPDLRGARRHRQALARSPRRRDRRSSSTASKPVLEAQLVDLADEIAYTNHDLEDGLTSRILDVESLDEVELWREHFATRRATPERNEKIQIRVAVRRIINASRHRPPRRDPSDGSTATLDRERRRSAGARPSRLVPSRPGRRAESAAEAVSLREPLSPLPGGSHGGKGQARRSASCSTATRPIRRQLAAPHSRADREDGLHRVVCDYIAGMTDRFALDEHKRLFDPHERL